MIRPPACSSVGCPQADKGQGFALPSGNIFESRIALLLETPASEEIAYEIETSNRRAVSSPWDVPDAQLELNWRRTLYPSLESDYLHRGAPVVGRSGMELFSWALRASGVSRRDVYLANVLQCYPGKKPEGTVAYPKGKDRRVAEACCAKLWWRLETVFKPDYSIVNFHPAAIIRDVTPLSLQIAAFARAKKLANAGHKVVVCCGGKAASAWMGYGENVTRWVGHVQRETAITRMLREKRLHHD